MVGIGMDIIEIERIRKALERRPKLKKRIFSEEEIAYCRQKANPFPSLAARFAAKEAALKAMGVGLGACSLCDIYIYISEGGVPNLRVRNSAASLAFEKGIKEFKVTLTHSKDNAAATVIAL